MQGLKLGVSMVALALLAGCGKSNGSASTPASGGAGDEAGAFSETGGSSGQAQAGTGGGLATAGNSSGGTVGSSGSVGSGGSAGGSNPSGGIGGGLPPDGPIAPAVALHKLDLLLMVDNSFDMDEKQRLLKDGVQWLLKAGSPLPTAGTDIHIGVITSSLGSHGASGMTDVCVAASNDDHAHLLGSIRPQLVAFNATGFLSWAPGAQLETLATDVGSMIDASGTRGCGYEASLESWYRFLVDPSPPLSVVVPNGDSLAVPMGLDAELLKERGDFLRPDSVLAVVMLSDENDCSIQDGGYGWLVARGGRMFRSTSVCATNPNDKCCQSCAERAPNAGCAAIESDVECQKGISFTSSMGDDLNLRCFDQKRRFGFSLLYPPSRYTDALTRQTVWDSTGKAVPNPIFAGKMRHPSQVILTGIVGVPWQDLADAASLTGAGLNNLTASELKTQGRWSVILGDPTASPPVLPQDPFMIETPNDRSEVAKGLTNPVTKEAPTSSLSTNPQTNHINGHETVNLGDRSLQSACTFPLATPQLCDKQAFDARKTCRCFAEDLPTNSAVCQPPGGGAAATTQYYELASPGIRHLQVLQSLGDNAIVGSACPKVVDAASTDYGYRPIMRALGTRVGAAMNP